MTPILFGLPSIEPLGSQSEECDGMNFFGQWCVANRRLYLVILGVSAFAYLVAFALSAPSYHVHTPVHSEHSHPSAWMRTVGKLSLFLLLGHLEADVCAWLAACCNPTVMAEGLAQSIASVGEEGADSVLAGMEEAEEVNEQAEDLEEVAEEHAIPGESEPEQPSGAGGGHETELSSWRSDGSKSGAEMGVLPRPLWQQMWHCSDLQAPEARKPAKPRSVKEPKPSCWQRLWPLAVELLFIIGYVQYNGLLLALLYVLEMDDAGWDLGASISVGVMVVFVIAVLGMCLYASPKIAADRAAREDGPRWTKYYHYDSGTWVYYHLDNQECVFEQPPDYVQTDVPAIPWDVRHGVDCLFEDYHCRNMISRFYPLVELASATLNCAMVMTKRWQGTTEAGWVIAGFGAVVAALATVGRPLIDESESQRDVENWATAVSLWLMAGGMALLATEDSELEIGFTALTLAAMLVVPIACLIDDKCYSPSEDDETEECEEHKNPDHSVGMGKVQWECKKDTGPQGKYPGFDPGWGEESESIQADVNPVWELSDHSPVLSRPIQKSDCVSDKDRRQQMRQKLQGLRKARDSGQLSEAEYKLSKRSLKQELEELRNMDSKTARQQPHPRLEECDSKAGGFEELERDLPTYQRSEAVHAANIPAIISL